MIQIIHSIFCICALVVVFFSRVAAWLVLALPLAHLTFTAFAIRIQPKPKPRPELSPDANRLFQQWTQYYIRPFAGADFSASSSGVGLTATVLAITGCFFQFWIGIAFGVLVYFLTVYYARLFNPTNFLTSDMDRLAHQEVIQFIHRLEDEAYEARSHERSA